MSSSIQGKCDVLILSANYGAGHNQVSCALKSAIIEKCPDYKVEVYDFFNYLDPVLRQAIQFSYTQFLKHFSQGYQWFYDATKQLEPDSKWQRMLNHLGKQRLFEILKQLSPKVIICTFPTPAGVVSRLKACGAINIPLVTVVTDITIHNQWVHPYVDDYIVGADIVARNLKRQGIPAERIHVTGIPLRKEFEKNIHDDTIWTRYGLNKDLFTLMVMGGGSGLLFGIEDVCEQLSNLDRPIQVIVITGTNKSLEKKLISIAEHSKIPIHIYGYVENIAEIMEISDLLLTKAGGVTVFEALAKKLPMIIYNPLPGHEAGNTRFLLRKKAAIVAKDSQEVVDTIRKCIDDPEIIKGMVKSIEPISKPESTKNAVDIILKAIEVSRNNEISPIDKFYKQGSKFL